MRVRQMLLWNMVFVAIPIRVVTDTNSTPEDVNPKTFEDTFRSVIQLTNMIRCQTGCEPLRYKRYGCFCGFKGAGRPVDVIDSCCLNHDWCYSKVSCPSVMLYVIRYTWLCPALGMAQCTGGNYANTFINRCAFQLCECDRVFGNCVSRFACPQRKAVCWYNPMIAFTNILS